MDGAVCDLIDRIRYGDPLLGWEGDDRIELYFDGPEERFELWRRKGSQPGMQFDDRIIHALIQWDGRRRTKALVDEVNEHNANRQAQVEAERDEWIAEDMAPRLRHAIRKDG
jgi:hypothetical protein